MHYRIFFLHQAHLGLVFLAKFGSLDAIFRMALLNVCSVMCFFFWQKHTRIFYRHKKHMNEHMCKRLLCYCLATPSHLPRHLERRFSKTARNRVNFRETSTAALHCFYGNATFCTESSLAFARTWFEGSAPDNGGQLRIMLTGGGQCSLADLILRHACAALYGLSTTPNRRFCQCEPLADYLAAA